MRITKFLFLIFFISCCIQGMVQTITTDNFVPKLREKFAEYISEDGYLKVPSPTLAYIFREGSEVLIPRSSLKYIEEEFLNYLFNLSIEVIKREIEYCSKGYLVFYHGQKFEHRILQDLKEIFYEMEENKKLEDFIFIRQFNATLINYLNNFENVSNYLKDFFVKYGDDHRNEVSDTLLPANFCLFGNSYYIGESSFCYFLNSENIREFDMLTNIAKMFIENNKFIHFCILKNKLKRLLATCEISRKKCGNLLQIFIPAKLHKLVYFSHTLGGHRDVCLCDNKKLACPSCILHRLKTHYIKWPEFIDQYSLIDVDREQIRILLQPKYFMNPDSGIKIFRYTKESKENKFCSDEIRKLREEINKSNSKRILKFIKSKL